jgi:Protein of unknown function (DUF2938)
MIDFILSSVLMGVLTTLIFDVWVTLAARYAGGPKVNWAMPGRWFAYLLRGRFFHHTIAQSAPIPRELLLGWFFHYWVGILFAAATLLIGGPDWIHKPTLGPALFVGISTVLCGWLILSPGLGFGIAGSAFPDANKRRIFQLISHVVFGFGLYLSARLIHPLIGGSGL